MSCENCINSIIIPDRNGYDTCTNCGVVVSFYCKLSDNESDNKKEDKYPKYSVYDEGFKNVDTGIPNYSKSVDAKYDQKTKEFYNTIQNYGQNIIYDFPDDIALHIYFEIKNEEKYKEIWEQFIQNPSKKNTFKIFRLVELPDDLLDKYKSRITKEKLYILRRKNIVTKWFQFKYYILEKENLLEKFKLEKHNLLTDDMIDLLKHCFNCLITQYFNIIGRNIRIASPNSTVIILSYLYLFNPNFIIDYSHLFHIPERKTIYKNIDIIIKIWKWKFRSFNNLRNYIRDLINEWFRGNEYFKENILNIDYEQEKIKCNKLLIKSKGKDNTIYRSRALLIVLNNLIW